MKYIDSKLFQIQVIIQLAFIILVLFFDLSLLTQSIISGTFLCIVGIPHGSNDYLYRKDRTNWGLIKFLLAYLGIIMVYALLWYYLPILALLLFFIISFHHFGQSNYENESIWHPSSILWGICLIMLPVILHFEEAMIIFKSMLTFAPSYVFNQHYPITINSWQIISISIFMLLYLYSIYKFEKSKILYYSLQLTLITIWYFLTPLLFGFIMVFCLWHSLQSLRHQQAYFKSITHQSTRYFYLSMLPFSSIALLFFILYLYFFDFNIGGAFILLSLITLPHVLIMHEQYRPLTNL
jgi:Brp/Blh family beta-carotene 15,15'-monooxygenase